MNNKEYISSGILENYVLGLTSDQETQEVEHYAKLYPEVQKEIIAIQKALNKYADKYKQTPPESLKQRVWSKIQEEENRSTEAEQIQDVKTIKLSKKNTFKSYLVAASIIGLIGSALVNVILYSKLKKINTELSSLNSEKEYFAEQLQAQKTSYNKLQNEYDFVSMPTTKSIILQGVENFPNALATVFFNPSTKEVYLKVNNLPIPPPDKQYQLWAIVDGKPLDAGIFDVNHAVEVMQKMNEFQTAQAFAVTLEKKGGSPSPSLDAMYVIGNV